MGERTSYTPGTFSWTDLTTTDQDGAKAFYTALFGWEAIDNPVGDGVYYTMMRVDGKDVAAVSPQPQQQRDAGVPPVWNSYITVESADESLARAKELGATIHADAFDVMDVGPDGRRAGPAGRLLPGLGAQGAHRRLARQRPGRDFAGTSSATPDMEASSRFYSELFGWTLEPMEGMPMPYSVIKTAAGNTNGGIRGQMPEEPPNWLVYFGTDDIDQSAAKVKELGGTKLAGPFPAGPGQIAIVRDPQGGGVRAVRRRLRRVAPQANLRARDSLASY